MSIKGRNDYEEGLLVGLTASKNRISTLTARVAEQDALLDECESILKLVDGQVGKWNIKNFPIASEYIKFKTDVKQLLTNLEGRAV